MSAIILIGADNKHESLPADLRAKLVDCVFVYRDTGKPFHNFITWQDLRASEYVKQWNKSYSLWVCLRRNTYSNCLLNMSRFWIVEYRYISLRIYFEVTLF